MMVQSGAIGKVRLRRQFEILTSGRRPWPTGNPTVTLTAAIPGVLGGSDRRFAGSPRQPERTERWNPRQRDRAQPAF